ncbi:MAG: ribonuclease R [Eubacteriales bacterium]|nr:ribonuclease R [Eubacteriales bacterium]
MEENQRIENALIETIRRLGPSAAELLMDEIKQEEATAAAIERMLASGRLLLTRKKKLALPEQTGLIYGRMQGNPRGYGFFIPADGSNDLFVPAESMHGVMNGDMVWVRKTDTTSRNGNEEAEVVLIAVRAQHRIVGTYEADGEDGYVVPDDAKLYMDVLIMRGENGGAKTGEKVVANILQYPDGRRPLLGRVTEVLGGKNEKGTDILSVIRRMDLPDAFSKGLTDQARRLNKAVRADEIARREDLRASLIITIDGEDAKDLDDAISLSKLACGNYLLGVHIADVSHYVTEGTPLDKEAYKRGTSVYFPDRVLPMFPKQISNGVCSLNEGEVKCTLSCMMEVAPDGRILSHRLAETVIKTAHRMTYKDVNAMFADDAAMQARFADVWPMLEEMRTLAAAFRARRVKRGSIDFDLDESKIVLDKQGKPIDVCLSERGEANRMIEDFMLAANETVATHMFAMDVPMLYRVHEQPDKDKLQTLNTFLGTMGYGIKNIGNVRPITLQRVLDRAKGTKEENVISRVTLRFLQKARYCETCLGHFGLAMDCYCHFTSPIRRYPDLVVHRIVKEIIHGEMTAKRAEKWRNALPEIARHTSAREVAAVEAERAAEDLKKAEYMQGHIGAVETGIIAGVTQYGFFVQLPNTVEGLVRIASIEGDYYTYDEKNFRVVGRATKRVFRLGDQVRVKVAGVDLENANVDFVLCDGTRTPKTGETQANGKSGGKRKPPYRRKSLAKAKG